MQVLTLFQPLSPCLEPERISGAPCAGCPILNALLALGWYSYDQVEVSTLLTDCIQRRRQHLFRLGANAEVGVGLA